MKISDGPTAAHNREKIPHFKLVDDFKVSK